MKEVTLKIPDKQLQFFMKLFKQLGLEVKDEEIIIPEEHKEIVRERLKNAKDENFTPWEDARKKLKFKTE